MAAVMAGAARSPKFADGHRSIPTAHRKPRCRAPRNRGATSGLVSFQAQSPELSLLIPHPLISASPRVTPSPLDLPLFYLTTLRARVKCWHPESFIYLRKLYTRSTTLFGGGLNGC